MSELNQVEKTKFKRVRRGGLKTTKKKLETAQILMEMGDTEAYETYKKINQNRAQTLQNQKTQLYLKQKFQEVVAKHKQITQNKPPVIPVISKKAAKKIRQAQQKQLQYYGIRQQTVTEQILHVISTIPPELMPNQIPSTSTTAPELIQNQIPSTSTTAPELIQNQIPSTSTIAPEQSVLQQPNPNVTIFPGQSTLQYPGSGTAIMTSEQNTWQQQSSFSAMIPNQILSTCTITPELIQNQIPSTSTIAPEQSVLQQPNPNVTIFPGQSTLQYPGSGPAIMTSEQNTWQQQSSFPAMIPQQSLWPNAGAGELATKFKRK